MADLNPIQWDTFLKSHSKAHILQTRSWGDLKSAFGWKVVRIQDGNNGAQILLRRILPGITMAYIPKGPIGSPWEPLINDIDRICRKNGACFVKVEPDIFPDQEQPIQPPTGFFPSPHAIQPPRTSIVSLDADSKSILGRMKQKTRYNINLARRKGVIVTAFADINLFHHLLETTGKRDQFNVHSIAYYQMAYDIFHPRGECELFLAQYVNEPLATLMIFTHGKRAWYFYGGSSNEHRDRMPNYLLQWEAMRWAQSAGCTEYDLWGIPDVDEAMLERDFQSRSDGLWGVYRFKRGFGGEVHRSVGPWDRVYNPFIYKLYKLWLKIRNISS